VELLDKKLVITYIYRSADSNVDIFLGKLESVIRRTQEHKKGLLSEGIFIPSSLNQIFILLLFSLSGLVLYHVQ
jgi:hypothetical protein